MGCSALHCIKVGVGVCFKFSFATFLWGGPFSVSFPGDVSSIGTGWFSFSLWGPFLGFEASDLQVAISVCSFLLFVGGCKAGRPALSGL